MKTKILLVTTSFEGISQNKLAETNEEMHYPVGLTYLHSYLESKGNQVKTLSLNHITSEACINKVENTIKDFSPQIIGIQVLTATRVSTYKLVDYLHKNYPQIKIVFGGIHATIMYKQLITKYPFVTIVLGEGEITMDKLSKELLKKKPNLKQIEGLAFFDKKEVVRTKKRELIKNLDELPFPAHELFLKDKNRRSACLLTSRGCFFACSFCCLNPESKRVVRFRSPKNVVDEIEYINKNFPHIKEVFIHDDSFFIDNKRVMEICDEIIKRKIKIDFRCSGRMKPISKEMIKKLEQAGFKEVLLGLESGSEKILNSCHKGITPEDVVHAFKLFSKSPISVRIFLIVGLPGETFETIKETTRLIQKIQKIKYFYLGNGFNLLTIYPGTEVYEIAKSKGFIDDSYWLTNKETPIYAAENDLEVLEKFQKYLSTNLSIYRIFTLEGFKAQFKMIPFMFKYFIKKKKSFKLILSFIKNFVSAQKRKSLFG